MKNSKVQVGGSIEVATQSPLDGKTMFLTLDEMRLNIEINAFKYYEDMVVRCIKTHKEYIWRETKQSDKISDKVLRNDFTYPDGAIAFGINYSNRKFNFFENKSDVGSDFTNIITSGRAYSKLLDKGGGATYKVKNKGVDHWYKIGGLITYNSTIEIEKTNGEPTGLLYLQADIFSQSGTIQNNPVTVSVGEFSGSDASFYSVVGRLNSGGILFQYQNNHDGGLNSYMQAVKFNKGIISVSVTYMTYSGEDYNPILKG